MTGDPQSPDVLAAGAYEAIRELNHTTFPGRGELADPNELYRVLANLTALARITPQTLRQCTAWLAREQQAGRIRAVGGDHADHPADAVADIETALAAAGYWLTRAARSLDDAHQGAAHLASGDPPTALGP